MTVSLQILRNVVKSKFFIWVNENFSGAMGTRHARLKYTVHPESKSLRIEIKCDKRLYPKILNIPELKDIVANNGSGESGSKEYGHKGKPLKTTVMDCSEISTDFKEESSSFILNDIIKSLWNSTSKLSIDSSQESNYDILNHFQFLRRGEIPNTKTIVEFGSPNIAKPLHLGHLRSTVTGNYVYRICKAVNNDVLSYCFLGDFGKQFGILQAGLDHWIPEEDASKSVDILDLKSLLACYVRAVQEMEINEDFAKKAHECCAALERGDGKAVQIWSSIREKTVNHLGTFWSLFDINYDVIQGESEFAMQSDHTEKMLNLLKNSDLVEVNSDGCVCVKLPSDDNTVNQTKIPIIKADGSSLYLTRDLACAIHRKENTKLDRMLYVVDKRQANHFMTLFKLLGKLGLDEAHLSENKWEHKFQHITFGKVEGMSTRSGKFVLLSDVIQEGSLVMEENRSKSPNTRRKGDSNIATQLAISALIVNSLKVRRNRDIRFDWNEALRSTGETGIRLQYNHARLCSLESKLASHFSVNPSTLLDDFDAEYVLQDKVALDLALHLANFEDAFWSSYSELEPCILLTYLFKLSDKSSKALKELKVQSEPNRTIANSRYVLFSLSRKILAYGMGIIGVRPLTEM